MQVRENVPLKDITYYKIGGNARYVLEVESAGDVQEAVRFIREKQIADVYCVGFGANVLFSDDGVEGAIIYFKNSESGLHLLAENKIEAFAGVSLERLGQFAFEKNLTGLGWTGGLPSSVGGAVRGNAGAFGKDTAENVESVSCIDLHDEALQIQKFDASACAFTYRQSIFKQHKNFLIVAVVFSLASGSEEQMVKEKATYQQNIEYRQTHHPMEYPSCGSVFQNVVKGEQVQKVLAVWPDIQREVEKHWHGKVSLAYVIGRLGFSGYRVGDAQVSEKHNNYISNVGNAKASDVKEIIEAIEQRFVTMFGFPPELELAIVQ